MRKYKAEVIYVNPCKVSAEKPMGNQPEGTPYLDIKFRVSHMLSADGEWEAVQAEQPGDDIFRKMYFLNPIPSGEGKRSSLEVTKARLAEEFDWTPLSSITEIIGKPCELVTHDVQGYERIKYVNNPNRKPKIDENLVNEFDKLLGV